MSDKTILQHIASLVDEEEKLRAGAKDPTQNAARIKHLEEQLDQCWDLLRQRRAKREFGEDPAAAAVRDVGTVERYEG
jgi:dephospho-CoA kinase